MRSLIEAWLAATCPFDQVRRFHFPRAYSLLTSANDEFRRHVDASTGSGKLTAKSAFGHPRGLYVLAGTELWERFSYYGMTALLVLYMVKQLLLPSHAVHVLGLAPLRQLFEMRGPMPDQAFASLVYGWYAGLVYFTPLLGGLLADRLLGARRTVMIGAVLMSLGHLAMSFDQTFLIALVLLIAGSGCLKGNISAQVAPLYPPGDDSRRDRGFTIFSTGINIGAVIGPLATGALAQAYGWHAGFACAAVLMLIALVTYTLGRSQLPEPKPRRAEDSAPKVPLDAAEKRRVRMLVLLILINVPIAVAYYQITNVGLIWIDEAVGLQNRWFTVPASWFGALDSFASIVAAVPLIALWAAQARIGSEPGSLTKVIIGALINGLASLLLVAGILLTPAGAKTSVLWPIGCWVAMGFAFMYYWPTTLALVAGNAPDRFRSTLMGGVFLALFLGNTTLGWVGSFYSQMTPAQFWTLNAAIGLSGAFAGIVLLRPMQRALAIERS